MSHLIVRGNPDGGTGQTELKPAQTDTDHFLLVPAAGTHLSTGDSAGMPQLFDGTPVVESGSNSDGEWVRWADGTQHVSKNILNLGPITTVFGSLYITDKVFIGLFAQPFVSGVSVTAFSQKASGANGSFPIGGDSNTLTDAGALYLASGVSLSPTDFKASVFATGRWK